MNISKKILKAINEGVYNALSFGKDELESSEEFDMLLGSSKNKVDISGKDLEKTYYSKKLQEMIPNAAKATYKGWEYLEEFVNTAIEWHEKYGATYNPHLNGSDLQEFLRSIDIATLNHKLNLNWIDTSDVTSMRFLFFDNTFNGDISEWDVSNVEDFYRTFAASSFKGDISNWTIDEKFIFDMFDPHWQNRLPMPVKHLPENCRKPILLNAANDAITHFYRKKDAKLLNSLTNLKTHISEFLDNLILTISYEELDLWEKVYKFAIKKYPGLYLMGLDDLNEIMNTLR